MTLEAKPLAPKTLAPIGTTERIRGVDIARGLALLGILLVNVRFFFTPLGTSIDPTVPLPGVDWTMTDAIVWSVVEALCSFKFISLFSILFGFGLAMQATRAADAGDTRWGPGLRRLGLLLAIGLFHGLFVWYGDILTLYACVGVIILCCARLSPRTLLIAAGVVAGITLFISVAAASMQWIIASFPEPFDPPELTAAIEEARAAEEAAAAAAAAAGELNAPRGWQAMTEANFDVRSPTWISAEIAAMREGPFLDALLFRATNFIFSYIAAIFGYGWHVLTMMLFGVYALRSGLFASDPNASRRRRKIALIAGAVGLPAALLAPGAFWIFGLESPAAAFWHLVLLEVGALSLPLAYASVIIEWGPRLPAFLATALERTGRMSLTVYLSESILCTALASWWGFALFGTMSDVRLSLIALVVWAALVVAATLWLQRFSIGPLEWLWRRATYMRNPA